MSDKKCQYLLTVLEQVEGFFEVVKDQWTEDMCNDFGLYDIQEVIGVAIAKTKGGE